VSYDHKDGYEFFLERGTLGEAMKKSGEPDLPTFKLFRNHPTYDSAWSSRGVAQWLTKVTVPTLTVGGYYDQEDMWGPQEEYSHLEQVDAKGENFLVLGPWRHGSWGQTTRHLGALQYGEPIGDEFRVQIEAPFFAKYLKDKPGFDLEDTASFQTGSNTWKRYAHFPPAGAKSMKLELEAGGKLELVAASAKAAVVGKEGKTEWVSDPANPVPYRHRPIQPTYGDGSEWYNWLVEDQSFVEGRRDVAVWRMSVSQDMTVTGEVIADLFASTTGTDSDWVVKLIDEYPRNDADPTMQGYQLMTNMEIFRGRYRESFVEPKPIEAGKPVEYKFSLHDVDHVFKKGHILMVEVQSTWFPLYDRNPQKFVKSIVEAKPKDFQAATQAVWFDAEHPSHLELPVVQ
jgi:hypothetical protein